MSSFISSSAAESPYTIKRRIALEREGLSGSPLRQQSISSCTAGSMRKLMTGNWPVLGLPRLFCPPFSDVDILYYKNPNPSVQSLKGYFVLQK
jgi:hypothetical protein